MIKRFFILIFMPILFLVFCGCNGSDYVEPEKRIVVSAIGIDHSDLFNVTLETVSVVENSNQDEYSALLYSGVGDSIEVAVADIARQISGDLSFYHCPIIICGANADGNMVNMVLDYVIENHQISLATALIKAENAAEILALNNEGKEFVGYKISELLKLSEFNNTATMVFNSQTADKSSILPKAVVKNEKFIEIVI